MAALARAIGDEQLAMQRRAGDHLGDLVLRRKGAGDLVTEADEHAHRRLLAGLPALEDLPFVLEESAHHEIPRGPFWVCDELDGTINFSRGRPGWGISLARIDGAPTHGVFYLPAHDLMITAERGRGCHLAGAPVRLRGVESLTDAVAGCEVNPHHDLDLRRRFVDPVTTRTLTSTVTACAVEAAAELLRGRTDLYLNCRGARIWDFAATALAVTEAGGQALDLAGRPLRWDTVEMGVLFAANRTLADAVLAVFEPA
jgi:myo-inositol-1(or 4)-monophosphatase